MNARKIIETILALGLLGLSLWVALVDQIVIPSRMGSSPHHISPPASYFISASVFAFACLLLLSIFKPDKSEKAGSVLLVLSIALAIFGLAFGSN